MNYPSKLILLGEYTVIKNGAALAIPHFKYNGNWSCKNIKSRQVENSRIGLQKLLEYIKTMDTPRLDWRQLELDLSRGLWFESNIPTGYGLGSSGAVCAALYDNYAQVKVSGLQEVKSDLAALEGCFHGRSSGIDPLVAYTRSAIKINSDSSISSMDLANKKEGAGAIFLIDTQLPRTSTPLINFFVNSCDKNIFLDRFVHPVKAAVEVAIDALLAENIDLLLAQIQLISSLQLEFLPPMLTPNTKELWQEGLKTDDFYLKICGAGGGGFVLGFTDNWEKIRGEYLANYNYELVLRLG